MFDTKDVVKVSNGNSTRSKINSIGRELNEQKLSSHSLKLLFPDLEFNEADVEVINEVIKSENVDSFSELLGLLVEHRGVLEDNSVNSLKEFVAAMKFVTYVNGGDDVTEAYIKAKSYDKDMLVLGASSNVVAHNEAKKNALMFSKSKLVMKLQAALDYPMHLLFAGYKYQAIECLRTEMKNAPLSKDRITAADRLLHHLTPQLENVNLSINAFGDKATQNILDTYRTALSKFAYEKGKFIEENKKLSIPGQSEGLSVEELEDLINLDTKEVND